jgi:hypothetical protein
VEGIDYILFCLFLACISAKPDWWGHISSIDGSVLILQIILVNPIILVIVHTAQSNLFALDQVERSSKAGGK